MTRQEMYSKAKAVINAQGGPSINFDTGQCMYRGPDGRKCAVGALIPDEEYSPAIEGAGIMGRAATYTGNAHTVPAFIREMPIEDLYFLQRLQQAHDQATVGFISPGEMAEWLVSFNARMAQIAAEYGLKDE